MAVFKIGWKREPRLVGHRMLGSPEEIHPLSVQLLKSPGSVTYSGFFRCPRDNGQPVADLQRNKPLMPEWYLLIAILTGLYV